MIAPRLLAGAALLAALIFPSVARAHDDDDVQQRYVQVTGEGEVESEPNQVILNFGVKSSGPVLNTVKNDNAARTQKLLDQLKKLGVDSADIQTDYAQIYPRYDYVNGKQKFGEYVAVKNFRVTLKDIPSYGKVLQAALDAGVESAGGAQFETSKKKELEDEARKQAVADARKKAEILAAAAGQKVGRALFIQDNGFQPPMPMLARGFAMAKNAEAVDDQLAPGKITIRTSLTVRFELQ